MKCSTAGLVIWTISFGQRLVDSLPQATLSDESALDLIVLHNNDLHGRFDESSSMRADCRPEEALAKKCFGGFARISTLVKRYRNEEQNNGRPVLFLNAGDTYVGTPWFYIFKDKITSELMNVLRPDVGALGNHEFDYGVNGLVPFLNAINFPIVAANLNISASHPLQETHALGRSVVFNVKNFKVGVIGYLLPETQTLSKTDDVGFISEIDAINEEAEELTKKGVKIIIALGHSGYLKDQEIARECPLVDVVVGSHSHSFLYTGTPPEPDTVEGPYPTIVEQKSGKKVPVVQAYCYSKYLGKLELSFDKDGNVIRWGGLPILLDYQIPRDPEVLQLLDKYRPKVEALTKDVVGDSKVALEFNCRNFECILGNLITDAWIYSRVQQYDGPGWTDAPLAILNVGGIRSAAGVGNITRFVLSTVLPFNTELNVVNVPGRVLKLAFEKSVEDYVIGGYVRTFLQISGIRAVYNLQKNPGQRVQSLEVLCSNCSVPVYEPLDKNKMYGVIIDSFLYDEGDGFTMFKGYEKNGMNLTALEATYNYIHSIYWVYPSIEGRITFVGKDGEVHATAAAFSTLISIPLTAISLIAVLISSKL